MNAIEVGGTRPHASKPAIKVCGLTRPEDVQLAQRLGARYLGGIRAGGPRLLSVDRWREVLGGAREGVERVAVLGAHTPDGLRAEALALGSDIVQWHGDPTPEAVRQVVASGLRVWPVLRLADGALPDAAWAFAEVAEAIVLDAKVPGQLGGTGVALDWANLAEDVRRWRAERPACRLVLAGGLTAANVRSAVALLEPDVVDVSSGVELAPGVKDPERMRAFVQAVEEDE